MSYIKFMGSCMNQLISEFGHDILHDSAMHEFIAKILYWIPDMIR
jgi:hypothetical protein